MEWWEIGVNIPVWHLIAIFILSIIVWLVLLR